MVVGPVARIRWRLLTFRLRSTVMSGDGLWHASMRAVVRTMMLTMGHRAPRNVFAEVLPVCEWPGQHAGVDAQALHQALSGCAVQSTGQCCGLTRSDA